MSLIPGVCSRFLGDRHYTRDWLSRIGERAVSDSQSLRRSGTSVARQRELMILGNLIEGCDGLIVIGLLHANCLHTPTSVCIDMTERRVPSPPKWLSNPEPYLRGRRLCTRAIHWPLSRVRSVQSSPVQSIPPSFLHALPQISCMQSCTTFVLLALPISSSFALRF
jgi:hypothetical protein